MENLSNLPGSVVVPANTAGKPVDIEKTITEKDEAAAMYSFHSARLRLLSPDNWAQLPGFKGANFQLVKSNIAADNLLMELNDHIKIELPGPGPNSGDGFDWVTVESMLQDFDTDADESFGLTLRASPNPFDKSTDIAAHYFKDIATATFLLKRVKAQVTVSYHGRNEVANIAGNTLHDQVRNTVVAFGALAGLSELQWRILLNGLLSKEPNSEKDEDA